MGVKIIKEKYRGKVGEVVLGATKDQGGTRSHTVTVGGETALPFCHFEGEIPNRPVIAMEIQDVAPDWGEGLTSYFEGVLGDPALWAKKCVEEYGADLIYVTLAGANPEGEDRGPDDCVQAVKSVLEAVGVPLIVTGCGDDEKDREVLEAVAEACAGENLLLGFAELENYKSLTAACMVHKHSIIARSPLDINICKQLNILINEMNLSLNKIVIDPSIGGLGYGMEYAYSILERIRLGALKGDKMLAMPTLCTVGQETWKAKEANVGSEEYPGWGEVKDRGILWEAVTAAALLQAGAHVLVMRNPDAVGLTKKAIGQLMKPNKYD